MARPRERDTRCTDVEMISAIRENYNQIKLFAAVAGIDYHDLVRVMNGRPCTEAEIDVVRQAWAKYSPDAMASRAEAVFAPLHGEHLPHPALVKDLQDLFLRMLTALRSKGVK